MNIKKTIGLLALMAAAAASAADPLLRVSVDGGQTWQAWGDFTGALRYIIAEKNPTGTADENIIELCADTTGATFGQSYDHAGGLRYTLRSKTGEDSQRFTVSGSGSYVFKNQSGYDVVVSNIVFSGGTFTLAFNWSGAKMTLGPGFKVSGYSLTGSPVFNGQDSKTALTILEGAEIVDNAGTCAINMPGTLTMYGGTIARNTATGDGAAVNVTDTGVFNFFGGEISANKTDGKGAVYVGRTAQLHIKGEVFVGDNTRLDGETKNNIVPYDATRITLDAPLAETAEVGVTLADGALEAPFGSAACEGGAANANRIVFDLNPVDGQTRYGCALGGFLMWVDAENDPLTYAFRATKDAGATWVYKKTFIEAVQQLAVNSDCTNNVVEILKDGMTGDGLLNSHGAVLAPGSFTFRSGNVGAGERHTLTRNHQGGLLDAGGSVSYVFTNVVVTGGAGFFLRSSGNVYGGLLAEFRDGFALRNCDCSGANDDNAHPVAVGSGATVRMYPGSEISSCRAQNASAVYVFAGKFEMLGGAIFGCTSTVSGAAVEPNQYNGTGAVIALSGGAITNNVTASTQDGGGVAVVDNRDSATYMKWIDLGGHVIVAGNRNANGPCDLSVRLANQLRLVRPLQPGSDVRCSYPAATAKGAFFATNETDSVACGAQYLGQSADLSLRGEDDGTGAIAWQGGLVVSGEAVALTGDKTVSFGHADVGLDGVPAGVWTIDGRLTIADGAKFTLNADAAYLEAHRDTGVVLARATAISGRFASTDCTGIPEGWCLRKNGGELLLTPRVGLMLILR